MSIGQAYADALTPHKQQVLQTSCDILLEESAKSCVYIAIDHLGKRSGTEVSLYHLITKSSPLDLAVGFCRAMLQVQTYDYRVIASLKRASGSLVKSARS